MIYKTILKWTAQILLFLFSLGVLAVSILFFSLSTELPDPNKLMDREIAQSTKIYDRNNKLLYEVHGDVQRTLVNIDQIPQHLKDAVITTEDRDFYHHSGFDARRFFGAMVQNILKRDIYGQGASTITQQLVKNTILSSEKTYTRKIKELILSIELEQIFNKDQILQIYLNEIPFGSTAYGVQAASEIYFDKNVQDLSIAEGAVLAAIIQAPSYYSPYGNHTDELSERHHWILGQMKELGYIDQQQLDTAINEQIQFKRRQENIKAPHFVFYVLEKLSEKYNQKEIEEGGLSIVTTLDLDKQTKAQDLVTEYAAKNGPTYNANNAALVHIDPKNGQIIAMVGSKDYWDIENDGNVNVATAERQPGSSFKPLVYTMAFADKWFPGSTLYDLKTDFGGGYTPDNYDKSFRGPVTIRSALQNSLNIPAVKILALVGLEKTIKIANDMGISSLNDPDRYGLSLVLGGGEVQLVELTGAYSVLANKGKYVPVNYLLKITDHENKILEEYTDEWKNENTKEIFNEQVAYLISNVLSDNVARTPIFGANSDLYIPGYSVAAKTGTTDEFRDGWTVGYTPSHSVGVWAGNNDNSPMNGETGLYVAAPIWNDYMTFLLEGTQNEEFAKPDGIINVSVDRYSNMKPVTGSETITDIGASWHAPTEFAKDVTSFKVCKSNGKLADDSIPTELVENKTFRIVHSEMPDMPNWETPVQGWASSAGLSSPPPTEKCTIEQIKPTISISLPTNNSILSNTLNISTVVNAPNGVKNIDFFLDGTNIGSKNTEPYAFTYDITKEKDGQHFVSVNLTDKLDFTASGSVNFIKSNGPDTKPPKIGIIAPNDSITLNNNDFPYSIQVQATDQETGINRVEFKINSVPQGSTSETNNNYYMINWSYPGANTYTIKAIAFDNTGNSSSASVQIEVK